MRLRPSPRFGSESGGAIIEFTLVLPVLLLGLAMLVDLGMAGHLRLLVQRGVAAGSYWAAGHASNLSSANAADTATTITSLVGAVAGGTPTTTVLINNASGATNADLYDCVDATTGALTSTGATSLPCPDGSTSGKFVKISANASYTPMLPQITGRLTNLLVGESTMVRVK